MEIELVVFDIAGTVIRDDNYVRTLLSDVVHKYVTVEKAHLDQVMGWPKPKALKYLLEKGRTDNKIYDDVFLDKLHKEFTSKMISFFQNSNNLVEIPGATEVFLYLKKNGIKVALDTGFSRPIADIITTNLGWYPDILDGLVASDEVANGRPAPDMIYHLMDKLSILNPRKVVKVGDTEVDIKQGQAANCGLVVGVSSGSCRKEDLLKYNPDYIINSVIELPELLSKI